MAPCYTTRARGSDKKRIVAMASDLTDLLRLTKSQARMAGEMCGRAFQDVPMFVSLIPDDAVRKKTLHHLFEFVVRYGVLFGKVYAPSTNVEGVAVWLPSDKVNMTIWGVIRSGGMSLLTKVDRGILKRFQAVDAAILKTHNRLASFPHWYLALIGVEPVFQGRGYAKTLLEAMLTRIDGEHLPCYLETNTRKNVSIFKRYGFKVVEEFVISDTGIENWAMLRDPGGRPA